MTQNISTVTCEMKEKEKKRKKKNEKRKRKLIKRAIGILHISHILSSIICRLYAGIFLSIFLQPINSSKNSILN